MKLREVLEHLRAVADERLAEDWDHVGLQVGRSGASVSRSLLCIDLTEPVLHEAVRSRCQLVVAYHPPLFAPLHALTDADWKQRIILAAARRDIAIYSPHTALDAANAGVNDWLAHGVGEGDVAPIRQHHFTGEPPYKIVVFVPAKDELRLRDAMAAAGAGRIGHYSHCSFVLTGHGTFKGDATTHPAVGQRGRLERVEEQRLEMICSADRLGAVVAALREVHPYEEPAFDLHRLEPLPATTAEPTGQGRIVRLHKAVTLNVLAQRIKRYLRVKHLAVTPPAKAKLIRSVAVCAGAGGSLLAEAGDVDALVTGEMRHHDILAAQQRGQAVLLAGHTETERPFLSVYARLLAKRTGSAVRWQVSRADRSPTHWH